MTPAGPETEVVEVPRSPELELVREMLAQAALRRPGGIEERRLTYELAADGFCAPQASPGHRVAIGDASGLWLAPPASGAPVLLYLHGGSYCMGSSRSHRHLAERLAQLAGAGCLVLDYRRGPEHPFPAALNDALAAVRYLHPRAPAGSLVLAGDSAGAGLALAATMRLRDCAEPLPAALVCFSPWTDLSCSFESHRRLASVDPVLVTADLRAMAVRYLAGTDPKAPAVSPVFGDLRGLPPVLVQVGGQEILLDDALELVRQLRAAGGQARLQLWPDLFHVWQWYHPLLPEGDDAVRAASGFVRSAIERGQGAA